MPTTIDSAGITFNDATSLTSAVIPANAVGATQIANGSVTAAKLGTNEQKQICKAWGIFDGISPVSILGSYNINISGITRTSQGNYTITFQNPMPNTDYAIVISSTVAGIGWRMPTYHYGSRTVNDFDILFGDADNPSTYYDSPDFSVVVFAS